MLFSKTKQSTSQKNYADCEGSFFDGNNSIDIILVEDTLFAVAGGVQKMELVRESETVFHIKAQPVMQVEFNFDDEGKASVVTLVTPKGRYPANRKSEEK